MGQDELSSTRSQPSSGIRVYPVIGKVLVGFASVTRFFARTKTHAQSVWRRKQTSGFDKSNQQREGHQPGKSFPHDIRIAVRQRLDSNAGREMTYDARRVSSCPWKLAPQTNGWAGLVRRIQGGDSGADHELLVFVEKRAFAVATRPHPRGCSRYFS
jgi:hypothetical protein